MTDACADPPPTLLCKGIEQFNRGEFFAQHETLEALWRSEPRSVRALYQGILQIGVAFYHLRRGNHHGAVYMLTRGAAYLRPLPSRCQGVDVRRLIEQAERALAAIRDLGPDQIAEFDWSLVPKVALDTP